MAGRDHLRIAFMRMSSVREMCGDRGTLIGRQVLEPGSVTSVELCCVHPVAKSERSSEKFPGVPEEGHRNHRRVFHTFCPLCGLSLFSISRLLRYHIASYTSFSDT